MKSVFADGTSCAPPVVVIVPLPRPAPAKPPFEIE
jgi:hypothetical protein